MNKIIDKFFCKTVVASSLVYCFSYTFFLDVNKIFLKKIAI